MTALDSLDARLGAPRGGGVRLVAVLVAALVVPMAGQAKAAKEPTKDVPAAKAAPAPVTEETLLGLGRDDVVQLLGKPQSSVRRGGREILLYANGARVELVENKVVAYQARVEAVVVASDGTRYVAQDNGNLARKTPPPAPPEDEPDPGSFEPAFVPATAAAPNQAPPSTTPKPAPSDSGTAPADGAAPSPQPMPSAVHPSAPPQAASDLADLPAAVPEAPTPESVRKMMDEASLDFSPPPPPPWVGVATECLGMLLRFGLVVLVLSLTMKWMELPFYWPDLMKVSVLYVAVREIVHGLGGLGGMWELLRIFRIDEGVGFFALAILLYRFGVTRDGLTALKIAAATKLVTYFLMIGAMLALTFGLLALR